MGYRKQQKLIKLAESYTNEDTGSEDRIVVDINEHTEIPIETGANADTDIEMAVLINKDTQISMEIDKDDRALHDVIIDDQLTSMGLQNDIIEKRKSPISYENLYNTLQSKTDFEESDSFIIDKDIDAYRINSGNTVGKCIVDFSYMFEKLHTKFDEHCCGVECSFRDLTFIRSRSYGLKTKFYFKCRMCHFEADIWSEPSPEESLDINTGAVVGTILTGTGYTQLQESCASMNINCMGKNTYSKIHEDVTEKFSKIAEESMSAAANEERELAIQENDIIN